MVVDNKACIYDEQLKERHRCIGRLTLWLFHIYSLVYKRDGKSQFF